MEIHNLKKKFLKIHKVIEKEKDNLLKLENAAVAKNERLRILHSIYAQPFTYYKLNTTKIMTGSSGRSDFINTRDYILNSK